MNNIEKKVREYESFLKPGLAKARNSLSFSSKRAVTVVNVRLIGKDKSTVTALVNKLSKLGYVKKEKCKKDRRVTYVEITEKSEEIEEKFNEISKDVYSTAYKNFSEDEKELFLKLLKKLNNNFD